MREALKQKCMHLYKERERKRKKEEKKGRKEGGKEGRKDGWMDGRKKGRINIKGGRKKEGKRVNN
jgi:hypothetical protein